MKKYVLMISVFFILTCLGTYFGPRQSFEVKGDETDNQTTNQNVNILGYTPYNDYLNQHEGIQLVDEEITIDLKNFTTDDMEAFIEGNTITTGERGKITWTFEVLVEGFYHLNVNYFPMMGKVRQFKEKYV